MPPASHSEPKLVTGRCDWKCWGGGGRGVLGMGKEGGGEQGHTLDLEGGGTKGSWVWNSAEGNSTGFAGLAVGLLGFAGLLSALRSEGSGAAGAGKVGSLPGTASFMAPATHTHTVSLLAEQGRQHTSQLQMQLGDAIDPLSNAISSCVIWEFALGLKAQAFHEPPTPPSSC